MCKALICKRPRGVNPESFYVRLVMFYFYLHVFYLRCLFQLFGLNAAPFQ